MPDTTDDLALTQELHTQVERISTQEPEFVSLDDLEFLLSRAQWYHSPVLLKISDPHPSSWHAVVSVSRTVFDRSAGTVTLTLEQPLPANNHHA